jgi:GTP-binding protein
LSYALAAAVRDDRNARATPTSTRIILHPRAIGETEFTITTEGDGYRVRGAKPQRWVHQTTFDNDEAVGYLADRLARLGVEDALTKLGAQPGAAVTIGEVTFDFEPASAGEKSYLPTRRGEDDRFDTSTRPRADQRLTAKRSRRVRPSDEPDAPDDVDFDE